MTQARLGQYIRNRPYWNLNTLLAGKPRRMQQTAVIVQQKLVPDYSFYDGVMDWDEVRTKTDAAIIREGQREWDDAQFVRNWAEAKARGIKRGTYRFYDDRMSPIEQALRMADHLYKDLPEMETVIDWETYYGGQWGGLPNVVACMQKLEQLLPSLRLMIYSGYYWFVGQSNPVTNAAQYSYLKNKPLWLAWYTSNPANVLIPKPWTDLLYWQWGTPSWGYEWGSVKPQIDMNYFNGTEAEFTERYGGVVVTPPPPIGGTMEKYKILQSLNMRAAPVTGRILIVLPSGSLIWGVKDTSSNWIHISKYQITGMAETPLDAWCSGYPAYVELVIETPPPAGVKTVINMTLNTDKTVSGTWTDI